MTATEMKRKPRVLPPVYLLVAIVVMVALRVLVSVGRFPSWRWQLAGIPIVTLGLGLVVVAHQQFVRARTAVKPFQEPSALVTNGVFRLSRNPMYLGLDLLLVGVGVCLGSVLPFVVVPAFHFLMAVLFVVPEERALVARFGSAYEAYRRRVRRWI